MHAYLPTYLLACLPVFMYVCTYVCMYVCMYVCKCYIYVYVYVHTYACVYVGMSQKRSAPKLCLAEKFMAWGTPGHPYFETSHVYGHLVHL